MTYFELSDQNHDTDNHYIKMACDRGFMTPDNNINWFGVLKELEKTKDPELRKFAIHFAQSWVTCACGNQCKIIPRNDNGEPKDRQLKNLGVAFLARIEIMAIDSAIKCLELIEERAQELLNERAQKIGVSN